MRTTKPFYLTITSSFKIDLDKFLLSSNKTESFKIEYYYFIFNDLIIQESINKNAKFYCLNKKRLTKLTTSKIKGYIENLKKGGFIISDEVFKPGVKSLWYKINPKYLESEIELFEVSTSTELFKKWNKKIDSIRNHYYRLPNYLKEMKTAFFNLELDYDEAKLAALSHDNLPKRISYLNSILRLENKRLRYFKRNKTNNRLDTNITNLKSDFRKFFIGDFINLDIKNSQPLLLLILIDSITKTLNPLCSTFIKKEVLLMFGNQTIREVLKIHQNSMNKNLVDLSEFRKFVSNGVLYDEMVKASGNSISRSDAKNMIFKILFSKNEIYINYKKVIPYLKEKEFFRNLFPTVYQIIYQLKKKKHTNLSIFLQRFESYLMIDNVSKELVSNGIIPITIHDSFIVPESDEQKAKTIISEALIANLGIDLPVKVERLKSDK